MVLPAAAQDAFEGRTIGAIIFPADQPLDERDLLKAQTIRTGAPLRATDIAAAIDNLYATGRFEDIRVEADPDAAGGVAIRFITTNREFIGHVEVSGKMNTPPNRGQLANATQLNLGTAWEESLLPAAEQNVRRVFESNGLYESSLQPQIVHDPNAQQVRFNFLVKTGKRARYINPVLEGDQKLSDKAVLRATGWQYRFIGRWKQVTESRTRNGPIGIQNRYAKDDRLMAKVELKSLDYDPDNHRLKPTLDLDAGPKVRIKAVEAKVKKSKLRDYVPVYQERRVDRDLLVEGARNLRDYFQTQGYYDVNVDFRQQPEKDGEVLIEYVISRGQRYKLVDVKLAGNKYFNNDILRERMFLEPAGLVRFRHGRYAEALRKKDEENIANLYKSNGFRDAKVESAVVRDVNGKTGDLGVTFNIDEGVQSFVEAIEIKGISSIPREGIDARLASIAGQPYSEVNVASDRAMILTAYYASGFPQAAFRWASTPGTQSNQVRLTYEITEGTRRFVRDVLVSGVKVTRQNLIDKRLKIAKGDPLSLVAITEGQKDLYDSGVLAKVNTAVQNPGTTEEYKYVLYDIEEAARYNLNVGFGAELARLGGTSNTLDSPAGGTGFSPRVSLDLSRLNMFGRAHFATLRGRFSTLQKRASIDYVAPRFNDIDGRNLTFTILYDASRDVRTFSSTRAEASVQASQRFSKATTGLFRYTWRRVTTSNVVIPALLVPQLLQPARIAFVSANIVQDRRDNPTDAHRGIFNTADLSIASTYLGSSRSFVRGLFRNATYHRLTRNVVLARETTFGAILPFSVPTGLERNESIPLPERFFGGGSTSHRGFPENQAGPRDIGRPAGPGGIATTPTGFPLGGNALLFNIVEARFPLLGENINGVFFHDMGNIYRSIGDISFRASQRNNQDFNYMVHAVGFGIRYKTPIGPVRGDLSYSVNPPSFVGFKGSTLDLLQCDPNKPASQLPGFCQGVPQRISHFQFFFSIGQTF